MNVQGIYTEIINLPTKIYEKELELLTTFNKESQVKEFLTRYESARKIEISEEEDENGKKLEVTLVINQKAGKVVFTYFDPIYKYTFAQDFTKNEISMNK